jgi:hypothetical protein
MMQNLLRHPAWAALLVFLIVFVPLAVPSRAMHTDEVYFWYHRTDRFWQAVGSGQFANTVQTEHPGVGVMILAGGGRWVLDQIDPERDLPFLTQVQYLRFPVKVANALALTLAFVVISRLVDVRVALLAALLWATEPYLRWYLRLIHVDGMSTTFMLLSLALLLLAFQVHRTRAAVAVPGQILWGPLVLAGVAAGWAALTRFSSFYMFGMVGLLALFNGVYYRHQFTARLFWQWMALPVAVFTGIMLLTWTALYPGMWTNANGILAEMLHGIDNAVTVHEYGSYFMGQPTADPGVWYYPLALPFRMSPWLLLGLPLAVIAALRGALRDNWRLWLAVLVYVGVYMALLTWQGKKFDRYALPVFPGLHLFAAVGWLWLAGGLARRAKVGARGRLGAWAAVTVLLAAHALWYLGDEYAYLNPALGGGSDFAEYALIMGAGEGLYLVQDFIAGRYENDGHCGQQIAAAYPALTQSYTPCVDVTTTRNLDSGTVFASAYIVNYLSFRQRFPQTQVYFANVTPVYVGEIHGVTYLEIYATDAIRQAAQATAAD